MTSQANYEDLAIRGTIFINQRLTPDAVLIVRGGIIERVGPARDVSVPQGVRCIEDDGGIIAPGFIDIHIHGSGGYRIEDDPVGVARHVVRHGTTYFLSHDDF